MKKNPLEEQFRAMIRNEADGFSAQTAEYLQAVASLLHKHSLIDGGQLDHLHAMITARIEFTK